MSIIQPPSNIVLRLVNADNGDTLISQTVVSAADAEGRCCWSDGLFVYTLTDFLAAEHVMKFCQKGNALFEMNDVTPAVNNIRDVCFDGLYFWSVDNTRVRQWADPLLQNQIMSWTHGLTANCNGIMFDGQNILVLSIQ